MSSNTSTEPAVVPPKPTRSGSSRPPTLTELAARMGERTSSTGQTGPSPSSTRPRLPASLLARTSSSQGHQPSSASSTSPDTATDEKPISLEAAIEQLALSKASDDSKKAENGQPEKEKDKVPRGYKNVPSLDALAERLTMARARTAETASTAEKDAAANMKKAATAPELEEGELEESPDQSKDKGHPLQHTWTLYHDSKARLPTSSFQQPGQSGEQSPFIAPPNTATGDYEAGLITIGEFNTVEDFCRYFNWLKPPSQLERNSNYHLFKDGIKPMWEDPANSKGGKWVLTMRGNPELLDRCWNWLAMALVGEELDERDEICGAVVSLRARIERIQLWLRTKDDIERINSIGKKLVKLLDVGEDSGVGLEFQYNTEDRPTHSKFISIVPANQPGAGASHFRPRAPPFSAVEPGGEAPPASAPGLGGFGGGMGSFSTGAGAGSAWRSRALGGAAAAGGSGLAPGRTGSGFLTHSRSSSASGATGGSSHAS